MGTAREKARTLLERVHLTNRETHRPSELSGGEQQRVCICRALMNEPELLLADEPTGNLDSQNATEVENLLETMTQEQGTALVLVTHNEKLAAKANNRVALFDGKILNSPTT